MQRIITEAGCITFFSSCLLYTSISRSNVPYRYQLQYADPCAAKQIYTQKEFERYFANRNENINLVHSILDDSVKHLIIVAGFGGGISMYCSEWIAKLAKKAHIPVTVVCTIPVSYTHLLKVNFAMRGCLTESEIRALSNCYPSRANQTFYMQEIIASILGMDEGIVIYLSLIHI